MYMMDKFVSGDKALSQLSLELGIKEDRLSMIRAMFRKRLTSEESMIEWNKLALAYIRSKTHREYDQQAQKKGLEIRPDVESSSYQDAIRNQIENLVRKSQQTRFLNHLIHLIYTLIPSNYLFVVHYLCLNQVTFRQVRQPNYRHR